MITSCTWLSRRPAAEIRTKRGFAGASAIAAAEVAHAAAEPADELEQRHLDVPLYGTRPSMPSGTSLSASETSAWK